MSSNRELAKLSESAGVDLLALKEKYSKTGGISTSSSQGTPASSSSYEQKKRESDEAENHLSKYKICPTCQGLGIQKTVYNHMVLERTCEDCDGDSIVLLESLQRELLTTQCK
eukprot:gene578-622_t